MDSGTRGFRAPALALLAVATLAGCASYRGTVSTHFDGERFYNRETDNSFTDHLKWMWQMKRVEWPEWIDDPRQPAPPPAVHDKGLRATYVNHATVLIQADGLNILTDPVWSDRVGPFSWLGEKRIRAPGVRFDDLPKIDVVLISHDHYDHLDLPTLARIVARDKPVILCGLGVSPRLAGIAEAKVQELDWWQEYPLGTAGGKISFVPARHGSGRGIFDGNSTLWGSYVIQLTAGKVLYVGDSAYGSWVQQVKARFPDIRLAILPVGSYEARWFMQTQHMNPDDAVAILQELSARQGMGIHFATFAEHPEQAIDAHEKDLAAALAKRGRPGTDFWLPGFGAGRDF